MGFNSGFKGLKGSCDHLPSQLLTENILYGAQYKVKFSFQRGKQKSGGLPYQ